MLNLAARGKGGKLIWWLVAALFLVVAGLVTAAAIRAEKKDALGSADAPPRGAAVSTEGNKVGKANLGTAVPSEAYNQTFQERLQTSIQQELAALRKAQDAAMLAAQQRQDDYLERLSKEVRDKVAAMQPTQDQSRPAAAGEANASEAQSGRFLATKIVTMGQSGDNLSKQQDQQFLGTPTELANATGQAIPKTPGRPGSGPAPDALVIPQGGFGNARTLNGAVASQGGAFRYINMKMVGTYTSANGYQSNLDGCIVLGEGTAEVNEGRIMVKPIKLTCTLANGRTRSWAAAGYVVDREDGMQGLRGTIDTNQQKRLLASAGASALERFGALAVQRETTSAYSPSTGQSVETLTGSATRAFRGGVLEGVGRGLREDLRDYFDPFKPTVQVGGGREITVFLNTESELPEGGELISTVRTANAGRQ